jgi:uncharacterized Zn finger protein (UPF0148 family)
VSEARRPDGDTRCPACGGSAHALDATTRERFGRREFIPQGARKALDKAWDESARLADEIDSVYAHLRAVVENCRQTGDVEAIRHQLVGLLPEVQPASEGLRERFPEVADLRDRQAREAWVRYGYPSKP